MLICAYFNKHEKKLSYFLSLGFIGLSTFVYAQVSDNDVNKYTVPVVLTTENKASISTEISGTIEDILVKEGDFFKKNDDLIKFNCTLFNAKLVAAQSELSLAKTKYESVKRLSELDGASTMEVQGSEADYQKAKSELEIAKHNVSQCVLKAPFTGQLVELFVNEFETVKVGTKLYDIVDNQNLEVSIIVPSEWLQWIKKGDSFGLVIQENQQTYNGQIDRVIYSVDSVSQSARLIGKIQGSQEGLFIGASGIATFEGP